MPVVNSCNETRNNPSFCAYKFTLKPKKELLNVYKSQLDEFISGAPVIENDFYVKNDRKKPEIFCFAMRQNGVRYLVTSLKDGSESEKTVLEKLKKSCSFFNKKLYMRKISDGKALEDIERYQAKYKRNEEKYKDSLTDMNTMW